MKERNVRKSFTRKEYERLMHLIGQLEMADAAKQKNIRGKLRNSGLYWSVVGGGLAYTVANFEALFAKEDGLKIIDEANTESPLSEALTSHISSPTPTEGYNKPRTFSDEAYVIDLCDEVLGEKALRQHRFDFLVGDAGTKLPVDAYYPSLGLVVEYHERQHSEEVKLFDRRETVSGVTRGEQRKIYDRRRAEILPKHGIRLVVIDYSDLGDSKKLQRDHDHNLEKVKAILGKFQ